MALDTAIRHLKTGNLRKAHDVVQNDPSEFGCWAHGIVHLIEGDLPNARYWYRKAHRMFPMEVDAKAEIAALATAIKESSH